MIKIAGITIIALILIILIKDTRREFAVILTIATVILLFVSIAGNFKEIAEKLYSISSGFESINSYITLILKILGIALISQFVVDLCRDSGENALAGQTEIAAKVIMLIITLPLFETVINIVTGLLK